MEFDMVNKEVPGIYIAEHEDDEGFNINIQTYDLRDDGTCIWNVVESLKDHDNNSTQKGHWTTNLQKTDLMIRFENSDIAIEEYRLKGDRYNDTEVAGRYLRKIGTN